MGCLSLAEEIVYAGKGSNRRARVEVIHKFIPAVILGLTYVNAFAALRAQTASIIKAKDAGLVGLDGISEVFDRIESEWQRRLPRAIYPTSCWQDYRAYVEH